MPTKGISSVRIAPDNATVLKDLGLLADLAGTWRGGGFNLVARPDFVDNANLYLQLNQTHESLSIDPIGSSIPNRGFGQGDIELFGLTYLQKISDAHHGGALHIEPGIWIVLPEDPPITYPPETAPAGSRLVARMGNIPHGNSLLAQGIATPFVGPPVLTTPGSVYTGSIFPSFNSTPFVVPVPPPTPPPPPVLNAAGSSELLTVKVPPRFDEYNLLIPEGPANPRTPFNTTEPPLPVDIDGVLMQDVINDPINLLQAKINDQVKKGYTFEGVAINIATQATITFFQNANSDATANPFPPTVQVNVPTGAGGTENILFLEGGEPIGAKGPNADTALVYATFWIEKVSHPDHESFMQLQYAQMVILGFPIFKALPAVVPVGWPHVSVATLRKSFN
jgi:hypothetical protein